MKNECQMPTKVRISTDTILMLLGPNADPNCTKMLCCAAASLAELASIITQQLFTDHSKDYSLFAGLILTIKGCFHGLSFEGEKNHQNLIL